MSRIAPLAPLLLSACVADVLVRADDKGADVPVDTDVAAPIDSDTPIDVRPHESDEPPADDTLPTDTGSPSGGGGGGGGGWPWPGGGGGGGTPADTDTDTAPPIATYSMYAHSADTLYAVDPATNQVSKIGKFLTLRRAVVQMADIAIDLQGHLYAGAYDTTASGDHTIYAVDPTTGRIARVCDVPLSLTGMTFLSDGRLVAAADHAITVIDLAAGCARRELYRDNQVSTSGDVVGLPDGHLYWTVTSAGNDQLLRVDPATGTAVVVGTTGTTQIYGLGYDEPAGVLYGFSNTTARIHTIDPSTARTAPVPGASRIYWWGATTNPVVW